VLSFCVAIVLCSSLVAVAWRLTEATYVAESVLQAKPHQVVVFTSHLSRADDIAFVRSQEKVVVSPQVLTASLNDKRLAPFSQLIPESDADNWLKGLLKADFDSGAELMSISVRHTKPELAQTLCNCVADAYVLEIRARIEADQTRRRVELEKAASDADRELDELWKKLNAVAGQVGSDNALSLTMRDELKMQSYREYSQKLRSAEVRATELKAQLAAAKNDLANHVDEVEVDTTELAIEHPRIRELRDKVASLDSELRKLRVIAASDDSPRIVRLIKERQHYESELQQTRRSVESNVREQSRLAAQEKLESNVQQIQKQSELNRSEIEFLQNRMAELSSAVVRTAEKNGVQLEIARHAVDRQTRLADSLWQSLEEFNIESRSQPKVTLLKPAELPVKANQFEQIKVAGVAGIIGLGLAILGVGFIEWRGCRIRNGEHVLANCVRPAFGIRSLSNDRSKKVHTFNNGSSDLAARMMLPTKSRQLFPCVMVTSALDEEPRHLVAMDLGFGFMHLRRRTLLIDCDMDGKLTAALNASHLPGVLQLDQHSNNFNQYVMRTSDDALDFLPLGISNDPSPWIDPDCFELLLDSLKTVYQAIVISGPAMSTHAESLLLAYKSGQVAFAAFPAISRWDKLSEVEQVAIKSGINVVGTVLRPVRPANPMTLRFDTPAATTRQTSKLADLPEISLQDEVTQMQAQIKQAASSPKSPAQVQESSNEITS
tara:strand:+ start:173089 stop:175245 length:2157 start_codon:yes stop_codon:yes gene_type:complete